MRVPRLIRPKFQPRISARRLPAAFAAEVKEVPVIFELLYSYPPTSGRLGEVTGRE